MKKYPLTEGHALVLTKNMAVKKKLSKKPMYFLNPWELVVLFMLPVLGFLLGIKFQQYVDNINVVLSNEDSSVMMQQSTMPMANPTGTPIVTSPAMMHNSY